MLASNLEEAGKLENLINNLLRLTRLEAGELQEQFVELDSTAITTAAIDQIKKLIKDRGIDLQTDVKKFQLSGDQASLVQLLVILLDNAVKYSPRGSEVQLSASVSDGQAVFSVRDHGSGIKPEALEHVFDRFYRGENSRNKAGSDGFGLGLSIAKMIADIHHGQITLSSRVGHGTTATVTLPVNSKN